MERFWICIYDSLCCCIEKLIKIVEVGIQDSILIFQTSLLSFDKTFLYNFFLLPLIFFFNSLRIFLNPPQSSSVNRVWWCLCRNLSRFCCNTDVSQFFIHNAGGLVNLTF